MEDAKQRENVNVVFVALVCALLAELKTQGTHLQLPRRSPHKASALSTLSLRKDREPLSTTMLVPRKAFGALTFILCVAGLFVFSNSIVQWSVYLFGSHAPLIPYTTHVVLFHFKETTNALVVKEVRNTLQNTSRTALTPCRSRRGSLA